jgi:hypothetical protein
MHPKEGAGAAVMGWRGSRTPVSGLFAMLGLNRLIITVLWRSEFARFE